MDWKAKGGEPRLAWIRFDLWYNSLEASLERRGDHQSGLILARPLRRLVLSRDHQSGVICLVSLKKRWGPVKDRVLPSINVLRSQKESEEEEVSPMQFQALCVPTQGSCPFCKRPRSCALFFGGELELIFSFAWAIRPGQKRNFWCCQKSVMMYVAQRWCFFRSFGISTSRTILLPASQVIFSSSIPAWRPSLAIPAWRRSVYGRKVKGLPRMVLELLPVEMCWVEI